MKKIAVAVATAFAVAAPASAQEAPRLARYDDVFASQVPGTSTARHAETDIVNATDPNGKPVAISHVHAELAPGTVVNTSAVPQCLASDGELMARGQQACPADSVVGSGLVDFDTGAPEPNRHSVSDITFINAPSQLVFLATERSSGAHLVIRGTYSKGNVLDVDVPPIPGTPPDGGADTHEIINLLDRNGYITTPPTCPDSGKWTQHLTYTFRDGVTQTFTADTPCHKPAGSTAPASRPRVHVGGVPHHRCVRRSFSARVAVGTSGRVSSVDVIIDGRRVRSTSARKFATRVPIRALRRGRHRLTIVARDDSGQIAVRNSRFRRC